MVGCDEIVGFRLRLGSVLARHYGLRLLLAWTMMFAFAVVLLRVSTEIGRPLLVWGFLGYVPVVAAGVLLSARRIPSAGALRAALDRHGELGGLLMAAGERDIGPWSERIPSFSLPVVRLRSGNHRILLPAAAAFLAASFLVPDRYLPSAGERSLEVGAQVDDLAEKLQLLKQEQLMPPEKAQVLEKSLEQVRQEASGKAPAKTMEAIDHLERSMAKAAAEAVQSAAQQSEAAGRAQALAQALEKAQGQMDPKQLAESMKDLANLAEEAAAQSESLAQGLDQDLLDACRQGNLTPEQLKRLSEALAKCKDCQRIKIEKLIQARLVDIAELGPLVPAVEDPNGELAAILGECDDGDLAGLVEGPSADGDGLPGRGGRNRGRADAVMTWAKGDKDNVAFKEKALAPAAVASLKQSRLAGMSWTAPTAAKHGSGSSGGALANAAAGGGAARTQIIFPEHEKSVRRYFDRQKQ
jgi:hypothetical protein